MLEEQTNEPVDQASQEPSAGEGETQTDQNVESTEPGIQQDPATSESDTHDTPKKGNDSVDPTLPADLTDREKSAVRKMHEATQQAAQYKKEADAFQELLNHPEFNEFLQWQKQKKSAPQPTQEIPQVELSEDELLAAQTDPTKFNGLLNSRLQSMLNPIAQQAMQKISNLERELNISKQERAIDAVASKYPDFWDVPPIVMKAALTETKGQGPEAAYHRAKQLEKQYLDKANSSMQKKVAEKKKASSASPSRSVEPKVIYAETQQEADRIAFEEARLNPSKRVDVRVRRKK